MHSIKHIVLLADAWGPVKGGINAFNIDFTLALGKYLKGGTRLICVVKEAHVALPDKEKDHIEVININKPSDGKFDAAFMKEVFVTLKDIQVENVIWWVGHDLRTGKLAASLKERYNQGKLALIHHMSYLHYEAVAEDPNIADERVDEQRQMFQQADHIFAIGPLLTENAKKMVGERGIPVSQMVPGLAEIKVRSPSTEFTAITYGRYSIQNDQLKQIRLGIHAFADVVKWATDPLNHFSGDPNRPGGNLFQPHLYAIGVELSSKELGDFRDEVFNRAERYINLWPLKYTTDKASIFEKLAQCSLAMMLSWHEGFGLTGWEAISAEVPLIISQNSGLWKLIHQRCGGLATGLIKVLDIHGGSRQNFGEVYTKKDLEGVTEAIKAIARNVPEAKKNASDLKDLLLNPRAGDGFTWENTVKHFLADLGLIKLREISNPFRQTETALYASGDVKLKLIDAGLTSAFAIDDSIRLIQLNLNGQTESDADILKVKILKPEGLEVDKDNKYPTQIELDLSISDFKENTKKYIKNNTGFPPDGNKAEWKIGLALVRMPISIFDEDEAIISVRPLNYRVTNVFNRQIVYWKNAMLAGSDVYYEALSTIYKDSLAGLLLNNQSFNFKFPSQLFVELAIVSKDHQTILVKKEKLGPGVLASLGMSWTCGPEFGLSFNHLNEDGSINIHQAVVSSMDKEFGISAEQIVSWHISGLALQVVHLNSALYGYCKVDLTGEEICEKFMKRNNDQFVTAETGPKPYPELCYISSDLRNVLEEDERYDGEKWHPTAKIRLYSLLNARFS